MHMELKALAALFGALGMGLIAPAHAASYTDVITVTGVSTGVATNGKLRWIVEVSDGDTPAYICTGVPIAPDTVITDDSCPNTLVTFKDTQGNVTHTSPVVQHLSLIHI